MTKSICTQSSRPSLTLCNVPFLFYYALCACNIISALSNDVLKYNATTSYIWIFPPSKQYRVELCANLNLFSASLRAIGQSTSKFSVWIQSSLHWINHQNIKMWIQISYIRLSSVALPLNFIFSPSHHLWSTFSFSSFSFSQGSILVDPLCSLWVVWKIGRVIPGF